jgi:chemotaxis protein MotB
MARRRRKVFVDTNNHDRWIVSYADFITLLFAFFVVMYSISSVNEGKYKSLSQSLGTAFSSNVKQINNLAPAKAEPVLINPPAIPLTISFESQRELIEPVVAYDEDELLTKPVSGPFPLQNAEINPADNTAEKPPVEFLTKALNSIQLAPAIETPANPGQETGTTATDPETLSIKPVAKSSEAALMDLLSVAFESVRPDDKMPDIEERRELSDEILKERRHLNEVSDQLEQALEPFIEDNLIEVKRNDFWIELNMNSELLFLSGEAALSKKAQPALKEIAQVVNSLPNAINVEGHTDNIPISNAQFPSNWELSSARATSVVQQLINEGVNPLRLSAVGYGEFHPIGDNISEEGRFKNRRVTLVLMSQAFARYGANDAERARLLNLKPTLENGQPPAAEP